MNIEIRDDKLQCDIPRKAAKILALSSRKIGKSECFTGEEILSRDQRGLVEVNFAYSPLGKAF